ncbi:MAG: hypothetical protein Q4A12_07505 [Eubacteriales bacterium]|nr:hypothetical protein [Eubacteriales bacterium]
MIKGINHMVIEVADTDNRYYERAFLVLRPECASISRELLEKEARKLLSSMDTVSSAKPKSVLLSRLLTACMFFSIGALLSTTIFILI